MKITLAKFFLFIHKEITPRGEGRKGQSGKLLKIKSGNEQERLAMIAKKRIAGKAQSSAKKEIAMSNNSISNEKAPNPESRIAELEAKLAASQKAAEESKKRMAELEAKMKRDKEADKKRQEEKKADKAELAALKKALNAKKGQIDILADCMIAISKEKPEGWTRKELFKRYLEALGMDEAHEKAPLKEATLHAQCGSRIQPRLEKLGYRLERAASSLGNALYICTPIKG